VGVARERRHGELDREEIVAAALRVTRRVGLDGLTMRGLAEELRLSSMATYYHVSSKGELLDLVADAVLDRIEVPDGTVDDWAEWFRRLLRSSREQLLAVSGLARLLPSRPLTPNGRRLAEEGMDVLRQAGFSDREAAAAHATLDAYLFGQLILEDTIRSLGGRRWALDFNVGGGAPPDDENHFEYGVNAVLAGLSQRLTARRSETAHPQS
jgi:AcrR family transcriptional regulator